MTPYLATFPNLPGYVIFLAEDGHDASHMARKWYRMRFARALEPYELHLDGVYASWERDRSDILALSDLGRRGVAYWTPEGWVVVPEDMDAPGPVYRAPQHVHAYRFSGSREDGQTIIFASNAGDAWSLYRIWADLHGRSHERVLRFEGLSPGVGILRSKRLMQGMELGITGVASKRLAGWDILPPWDECAGDN